MGAYLTGKGNGVGSFIGLDISSPQGQLAAAGAIVISLMTAPWWAKHVAPLIAAFKGHKVPAVEECDPSASIAGLSRMAAGFLVPVVGIDTSGIIQIFNAEAEALTGWRREEIIGSPVSLLMGDAHGRHHQGYVEDYLEDRQRGTRPALLGAERIIDVRHRDGHTIICSIAVTEYSNGWSGFWGWFKPQVLEGE